MKGFVLGILSTIVAAAVVVLAVFGTGWYDMGARRSPDVVDRFGAWAKRRSVPAHAPERRIPTLGDPEAIEAGLAHYATNCLPCHDVPGVEGMEFHEGMLPEPPHIDDRQVQRWSEAELFWIVKNGIRMTGRPAFGGNHSDEEIAQIVAFVRHAPELTEAEARRLAEALPEGHHHGDAVPPEGSAGGGSHGH